MSDATSIPPSSPHPSQRPAARKKNRLAPRFLEPHRHPIPERLQRQRHQISGHLSRRGHEFPDSQQRDLLVLIVGALFALPFIFFSLTGGYFADRYSKRSVVIGTKLMEIFVMGVTILGLWLTISRWNVPPFS